MDADQQTTMTPEEQRLLAIQAEALYLANLLIMPLVSFLWLLVLAYRNRHCDSRLVRCHLKQTVVASLWAGVLLLSVTLVIIALNGHNSIGAWTVAILYFTVCHSTLVLFGIVGLTKAMAGEVWRYPLIGPRGSGCR